MPYGRGGSRTARGRDFSAQFNAEDGSLALIIIIWRPSVSRFRVLTNLVVQFYGPLIQESESDSLVVEDGRFINQHCLAEGVAPRLLVSGNGKRKSEQQSRALNARTSAVPYVYVRVLIGVCMFLESHVASSSEEVRQHHVNQLTFCPYIGICVELDLH